MTTPGTPTELLFSYGTLQLESVQLATFGRKISGTPDSLPGFARTLMEITDPDVLATSGQTHYPIVAHTGDDADQVTGTVFEITAQELANADAYEADDYMRVSVTLATGKRAWVYVDARKPAPGASADA
ncbi:MAG: gamma-glutamylcyclotransferase [Rhodocyclales bacterium]|nr:gamma-glutamylcyclotransferase [Rhodocyclales bacterium]